MTPHGRPHVVTLRQWKALRRLHESHLPPVPPVRFRRQPSRRGLLIVSVLAILAALVAFYFAIEATLPAGVGR